MPLKLPEFDFDIKDQKTTDIISINNHLYRAVRGPTYPIKDKLKNLGGTWKQEHKLWYVPENLYPRALAFLQESLHKDVKNLYK